MIKYKMTKGRVPKKKNHLYIYYILDDIPGCPSKGLDRHYDCEHKGFLSNIKRSNILVPCLLWLEALKCDE